MGKKKKDKPDAEGDIIDLCKLTRSLAVLRQATDSEQQHFFERVKQEPHEILHTTDSVAGAPPLKSVSASRPAPELASRSTSGTEICTKKEDDEKEEANPFREKLLAFLGTYPFGRDKFELIFSPLLSSTQRKEVHSVAEELGLDHQSFGLNRAKRRITVSLPFKHLVQPPDLFERFVVKGGCVYFEGPCVDLAGNKGDVDEAYISKRKDRDGSSHSHITLMHVTTIEKLASDSNKTLEDMTKDVFEGFCKISDDWRDLGLGRVQNEDSENEAFFRVLDWPAASAVRKRLGAPNQDFHISVGYKSTDIHGVRKDASTLIGSNDEKKEEEKDDDAEDPRNQEPHNK